MSNLALDGVYEFLGWLCIVRLVRSMPRLRTARPHGETTVTATVDSP